MTFQIQKTNFYKNPFIGLYLRTNDRHTLLPPNAPEKLRHQAHETLGTQAIELFINQSPLIGLFCVLNNHGAILAAGADPHEKSVLKKHGYNVYTLKSSYAPGNVLLFNNRVGMSTSQIPDAELKAIGECLGIEMFAETLSGMHTLGATNVVTDTGLFAYNDVTDVEFKHMQKRFGVGGVNGTTNGGVPFNAFGVTANARGALVGDLTSGFEIQRVFEALSGE